MEADLVVKKNYGVAGRRRAEGIAVHICFILLKSVVCLNSDIQIDMISIS
jgi:hypothetical protein